MWGVRAIRVGVLLCGSVVGAGCQHVSRPLIPSANGSIEPRELKAQEETNGAGQTWHRGGTRFKDQPSHLTPDQITGGIY